MRALVFALALAAVAATAHAQVRQTSIRLNDPALASQYLSVADKSELQGAGAFTLEAWVYPTSYAGFPTIIGNDYTAGYWLGLNTVGQIRFYPRANTSVDAPPVVPLNQWSHIAATYHPVTGYAIYLDGELVASGSSITGAQTSSAGDLRIGADREGLAGPSYFWRGHLDEIRIWQGVARTTAQIVETMYMGVGTPALNSSLYSALEGDWDMELLPAAPDVIADRASAGFDANDAVVVGGTRTAMVSDNAPPVVFNQAVEFNGTNYARLYVPESFANGLTISAWVCPYSFSGFPTIVGRGWTQSFWLGLTPSGDIRFYPCSGGRSFDAGVTLNTREFRHIAATYKDGLACIYLDGELVKAHTGISGPVFENGAHPWVGADSTAGGPTFTFTGMLDNVMVAAGAMSRPQIRTEALTGRGGVVFGQVLDETGSLRWAGRAALDKGASVYGTNARIVRSYAPLFLVPSPGVPVTAMSRSQWFNERHSGVILPETFIAFQDGSLRAFTGPTSITSVDVFLSAATIDLSQIRVTLRSPAGTEVDLVTFETLAGRDLQTVFSDSSPHTLATATAPYIDGVQPSESLSAFDGEDANGNWLMWVDDDANIRGACLNAWGLRFNGLSSVDAPAAGVPTASRLRNAGASVVRTTGQLAFALARDARVQLDLLDVQGRAVRSLMDGPQRAGEFRLQWNAGDLASGVYFARLRVDGETSSVRVAVVH